MQKEPLSRRRALTRRRARSVRLVDSRKDERRFDDQRTSLASFDRDALERLQHARDHRRVVHGARDSLDVRETAVGLNLEANLESTFEPFVLRKRSLVARSIVPRARANAARQELDVVLPSHDLQLPQSDERSHGPARLGEAAGASEALTPAARWLTRRASVRRRGRGVLGGRRCGLGRPFIGG